MIGVSIDVGVINLPLRQPLLPKVYPRVRTVVATIV